MGLLRKFNKIIVKIIIKYLLILEEEKKKTTFLFVFLTYLPVFLLKFRWESSLDAELNSTSNEYPLDILLTDPATPKTRNT